MGLIQPFAIKTQLDNTDLELTADPGESFLIKDIMTHYCAESYCTMRTDKSTVGYFRQGGVMGAHIFRLAGWNKHSHDMRFMQTGADAADASFNLTPPATTGSGAKFQVNNNTGKTGQITIDEAVRFTTGARRETLLQFLAKKGLWKGFPVAEGETFKITGVAKDKAKQCVIYEIHEAGDMTSEMENGSKSPSYMFLNYGNCTSSINKTGDSLYNLSISPAEFPSFPFDAVVPANHQIELLGICASPFAPKENDANNQIYMQFMKLIKDREVLFDEDRQGILFENRQGDRTDQSDSIAEGMSLIGNKSEYDPQDPFMFEEPLIFKPGDELGIYVTTVAVGDGQDIAIDEHEICLIERVTRLE